MLVFTLYSCDWTSVPNPGNVSLSVETSVSYIFFCIYFCVSWVKMPEDWQMLEIVTINGNVPQVENLPFLDFHVQSNYM